MLFCRLNAQCFSVIIQICIISEQKSYFCLYINICYAQCLLCQIKSKFTTVFNIELSHTKSLTNDVGSIDLDGSPFSCPTLLVSGGESLSGVWWRVTFWCLIDPNGIYEEMLIHVSHTYQ